VAGPYTHPMGYKACLKAAKRQKLQIIVLDVILILKLHVMVTTHGDERLKP
jgi:hypothetical protein